jgi:predicted amidophosphoribosyltransferase
MKLANCPRCRRPFVNMGRNLCPVCIDQEDKAFDTIREYLDKKPGASLYQICFDTGIDEGVVISLIQRGKLRSVERRLTHKCARCGTEVLIVDGDFCERCQRELQSKVSRAIRDLSSKMELTEDSDGGSAGGGKRADGARDSRMFIRDIHREREDSD